jgi:hypothetical protein
VAVLVTVALLVGGGAAPAHAAAGASPELLVDLFLDGFETGSTCWWSVAVPEDAPPGIECGLASFEPPLSFVRAGQFAVTTIPDPLAARLYRPAPTDTFVGVASGDPASLSVNNGGVTVLAGTSDAEVRVDALAPHPGVTLIATLDAVQLQAVVRVLGPTEMPALVGFEPGAVTVPPAGSVAFEVVLDLPAPIGGTLVTLGATPGLGSLPADVTVPEDQLRASFTYLAGGAAGVDTLSATLGATTLFATVTIAP